MTYALWNMAKVEWATFDGWCASRNVDPLKLAPVRFLSLVYFWATEGADEKQRRRFDLRLWIPPKHEEVITDGPWTAEAEMQGFRGLASSLNIKTGTPATIEPE